MSAEDEDLIETTVQHEEVHTVTSETRTSASSDREEPTVVHRTEHTHRVIRKQRSWGNVLQAIQPEYVTKIRVSPRADTLKTCNSDAVPSPRAGDPHVTAIGAHTC